MYHPLHLWYMHLPRWKQWLYGPPTCIVLACMQPRHVTGEAHAFFVTLLLFVVSIVLSELLRPKQRIENARPAGLGDFQFPTATEGRHVPIPFGTVRQKGPNVVWYGDLVQTAITEKVKTGLWSSQRFTKGFTYSIGIQFALCRGPDVVLKRVWIGEVEVFSGTVSGEGRFDIDKPDLFGGNELGSGGITATCDFYPGTAAQSVSAYLNTSARQQVTTAITPTAPRYSGTCHIVARELTGAAPSATNLGAYLGNSTTVKPWSFEVQRFPALMPGQLGSANIVNTSDANPVNVVYELLTNSEWGFGFPDSDVDTAGFITTAATLKTEGNGFSFLLDRQMTAKDLLAELQRQMDGVVFLKQSTGKWTIKLARDDYDINTVPQLTDSNVKSVSDYTRGSWEDTTNTITVQYDKRSDDYKQSFALAQDVANAIIQGDGTIGSAASVVGSVSFPGVKDSSLAANLAWRELRGQSYPLARCTITTNRELWDVSIGDVVAWTNAKLGFTKLPMRVTRVDYGDERSSKIKMTLVQDIFNFAAASMGSPPASGWTPPSTSLVAFPAAQQVAFEAPRAIVTRDPDFGGDPNVSKVLCAARRQGGEVAFQITQRNAAGATSGAYADAGDVLSFVRIGQLKSVLAAGTAYPTGSILLSATPDSQSVIEASFDDTATLTDLGSALTHLVMVGNEFMLVSSASISGSDVSLANVYRGVLDSVQESHLANADVFLLHVGAGITGTTFPVTNNVDIELRAKSSSDTFAGAVTTINLTMAKRSMRPYPPSAPLYNGTTTAYGTPNTEGDGTVENDFGFDVDWRRRKFDTADEVQALLSNTTPDSSTEYRLRVFVDPDGVNTEIASSPSAWGTAGVNVLRNELIEIAAAGTKIRVQIETRHDILTEVDLTSRVNLVHDIVPTSVNDGLFYLGGDKRANQITNSYVVATAGVHTVRIGAAYATSNVQARINGGVWANIITAGGTSGTTASLASSDTIELRHTVNETPNPQFVEIERSGTRVAYGTMSN